MLFVLRTCCFHFWRCIVIVLGMCCFPLPALCCFPLPETGWFPLPETSWFPLPDTCCFPLADTCCLVCASRIVMCCIPLLETCCYFVLGIFWCPLQETCCFVWTRDVLFSVTGYWRRIVNMCWRWFVFRYRRLTVLYWRCVVFFYLLQTFYLVLWREWAGFLYRRGLAFFGTGMGCIIILETYCCPFL